MPRYYTGLGPGPRDATTSELNALVDGLDVALAEFEDGIRPFNAVYLKTEEAMAIASDTLTIDDEDPSRLVIDVESGSADNLKAITPIIDGRILIIRIAANARPITFQHEASGGNLFLAGLRDITLANVNRTMVFIGHETQGRWEEFGARVLAEVKTPLTAVSEVQRLIYPDRSLVDTGTTYEKRLALLPSPEVRNSFLVRGAAAAIQSVGIAAVTAGAIAAANSANGSFVSMTSTTPTPNGWVTATFNLVRREWNPTFYCVVETPSVNFDSLRYWIGLLSADVTNVDTLAASTRFIGFRYSTVAGDAGWRPYVTDGTSFTLGAVLGGNIIAGTKYLLSCRVDHAGSLIYFSVNGGAEISINTTLPAGNQDLGACARVISQSTTRVLNFSRMYVEYD